MEDIQAGLGQAQGLEQVQEPDQVQVQEPEPVQDPNPGQGPGSGGPGPGTGNAVPSGTLTPSTGYFFDQPRAVEGLPVFSQDDHFSNPFAGVGQPQSLAANTFDQGIAAFASKRPSFQTKTAPLFFDWDATQAERYAQSPYIKEIGFKPFEDNEKRFAERQTFGDVMHNALAGQRALAWTTFVDGWKGWGRMVDALFSWDAKKLMGSPEELEALDRQQKAIFNKYAIFSTPESEAGFFNKQFFGNLIQQSGFALGTLAQFASEELLTMGAGAALKAARGGAGMFARLAKEGITIGEVYRDAKRLTEAWKMPQLVKNMYAGIKAAGAGVGKVGELLPFGRLPNVVGDIRTAMKAGATGWQVAGVGFNSFRRTLAEANMAFTEARMEAASTYGQLQEHLFNDLYQEKGEVTGDDQRRIDALSRKGAWDNFVVNSVVISAMNRLQYDNMFRTFGSDKRLIGKMAEAGEVTSVAKKGEPLGRIVAGKAARDIEEGGKVMVKKGEWLKRAYEKGTFGALGNWKEIAADFGRKKAGWEVLKSVGRVVGVQGATEGFQENVQNISSAAIEDYTTRTFKNYYTDLFAGQKYENADWGRSVLRAAGDELTSVQGVKTFLMGAMTGHLISPISFAFTKGYELATTNSKERADIKKGKKDALAVVNGFFANPAHYADEWVANTMVQNKAAKNMEEALEKGDKYAFYNAKDDAFFRAVMTLKNTNMLESGLEYLEKDIPEHFSERQLTSAFGVDFNEKKRKSVGAYMGMIAGEVRKVAAIHDQLQEDYGDRINPELYEGKDREKMLLVKKAFDSTLWEMAKNHYKAESTAKRGLEIMEEVAKLPSISQTSHHAFQVLRDDLETAGEISLLKQEIASAKAVAPAEQSKELKDQLKRKEEQLAALEELQEDVWNYRIVGEPKEIPDKLTQTLKRYINSKNEEFHVGIEPTDKDVNAFFLGVNDFKKLTADQKRFWNNYSLIGGKGFQPILIRSAERLESLMEEQKSKSKEAVERAAPEAEDESEVGSQKSEVKSQELKEEKEEAGVGKQKELLEEYKGFKEGDWVHNDEKGYYVDRILKDSIELVDLTNKERHVLSLKEFDALLDEGGVERTSLEETMQEVLKDKLGGGTLMPGSKGDVLIVELSPNQQAVLNNGMKYLVVATGEEQGDNNNMFASLAEAQKKADRIRGLREKEWNEKRKKEEDQEKEEDEEEDQKETKKKPSLGKREKSLEGYEDFLLGDWVSEGKKVYYIDHISEEAIELVDVANKKRRVVPLDEFDDLLEEAEVEKVDPNKVLEELLKGGKVMPGSKGDVLIVQPNPEENKYMVVGLDLNGVKEGNVDTSRMSFRNLVDAEGVVKKIWSLREKSGLELKGAKESKGPKGPEMSEEEEGAEEETKKEKKEVAAKPFVFDGVRLQFGDVLVDKKNSTKEYRVISKAPKMVEGKKVISLSQDKTEKVLEVHSLTRYKVKEAEKSEGAKKSNKPKGSEESKELGIERRGVIGKEEDKRFKIKVSKLPGMVYPKTNRTAGETNAQAREQLENFLRTKPQKDIVDHLRIRVSWPSKVEKTRVAQQGKEDENAHLLLHGIPLLMELFYEDQPIGFLPYYGRYQYRDTKGNVVSTPDLTPEQFAEIFDVRIGNADVLLKEFKESYRDSEKMYRVLEGLLEGGGRSKGSKKSKGSGGSEGVTIEGDQLKELFDLVVSPGQLDFLKDRSEEPTIAFKDFVYNSIEGNKVVLVRKQYYLDAQGHSIEREQPVYEPVYNKELPEEERKKLEAKFNKVRFANGRDVTERMGGYVAVVALPNGQIKFLELAVPPMDMKGLETLTEALNKQMAKVKRVQSSESEVQSRELEGAKRIKQVALFNREVFGKIFVATRMKNKGLYLKLELNENGDVAIHYLNKKVREEGNIVVKTDDKGTLLPFTNFQDLLDRVNAAIEEHDRHEPSEQKRLGLSMPIQVSHIKTHVNADADFAELSHLLVKVSPKVVRDMSLFVRAKSDVKGVEVGVNRSKGSKKSKESKKSKGAKEKLPVASSQFLVESQEPGVSDQIVGVKQEEKKGVRKLEVEAGGEELPVASQELEGSKESKGAEVGQELEVGEVLAVKPEEAEKKEDKEEEQEQVVAVTDLGEGVRPDGGIEVGVKPEQDKGVVDKGIVEPNQTTSEDIQQGQKELKPEKEKSAGLSVTGAIGTIVEAKAEQEKSGTETKAGAPEAKEEVKEEPAKKKEAKKEKAKKAVLNTSTGAMEMERWSDSQELVGLIADEVVDHQDAYEGTPTAQIIKGVKALQEELPKLKAKVFQEYMEQFKGKVEVEQEQELLLKALDAVEQDVQVKEMQDHLSYHYSRLSALKVATDEELKTADVVHIKRFEKWIKKNLPDSIGLNVREFGKVVEKMLEGGVTVGQFVHYMEVLNGKEQVVGRIEVGEDTKFKFHEAFHSVFRLLLKDKQIDHYLQLAKREVLEKLRAASHRDRLESEQIADNVFTLVSDDLLLAAELERLRTLKPDHYGVMEDAALTQRLYEEHLADRFDKWQQDRSLHTHNVFKLFFALLARLAHYLSRPFRKGSVMALFYDINAQKFKKAPVADNRFTEGLKVGDKPRVALKVEYDREFTLNKKQWMQNADGKTIETDVVLSRNKSRALTSSVVASFFLRHNKVDHDASDSVLLNHILDDYAQLYDKRRDHYLSLLRDYKDTKQVTAYFSMVPELDLLHEFFSTGRAQLIEAVRARLKGIDERYLLRDEERAAVLDKTGDEGAVADLDSSTPFLTKSFLQYVSSVVYPATDDFGNAFFANGEPIVQAVDPEELYSGLQRATANAKNMHDLLLRMEDYGKFHEDGKWFMNKLKEDLGLELNDKDFTVTHAGNEYLLMMVQKELERYTPERLFFKKNLSKFRTYINRWDPGESAKKLMGDWFTAYSKVYEDSLLRLSEDEREEFKTDAAMGLTLFVSHATDKEISDVELTELSKTISNGIKDRLGISFHPMFLAYSLASIRTEAKRSEYQQKLVQQCSSMRIDPLTANAARDLLSHLYAEKNLFLVHMDAKELGVVLTNMSTAEYMAKADLDKSRMYQLALDNCFFDELSVSDTYVGADGKRRSIYAYPDFYLVKMQQVKDALTGEGDPDILPDTEKDPFFKDHYLLKGDDLDLMAPDLSLALVEELGNTEDWVIWDKNRYTGKIEKQKEGAIRSQDLSERDFWVNSLDSYMDVKEYTYPKEEEEKEEQKNGKKKKKRRKTKASNRAKLQSMADTHFVTARHVVRLDGSDKLYTINLPVRPVVELDAKKNNNVHLKRTNGNKWVRLKDSTVEAITTEIEREFNRIKQVKEERKKIEKALGEKFPVISSQLPVSQLPVEGQKLEVESTDPEAGGAELGAEAEPIEVDLTAAQQAAIYYLPIGAIYTDKSRFQPRVTDFSAKSVERVFDHFNDHELDPITLFKDPDDKLYVVSGHSRLQAHKMLNALPDSDVRKQNALKNGFKPGLIKAQILVNVTEQEAKRLAMTSNNRATNNKDYEHAALLRTMLLQGDTASAILEYAREQLNLGKNARYITSLAHLNPNGKIMTALRQFEDNPDKDAQNQIEKIAQWVGSARNKFGDLLTDQHENELFDFLLTKGKGKNSKLGKEGDFVTMVENIVGRFDYNRDEPLNLNKIRYKDEAEVIHETEEKELKQAIKEKQKEWDALNDRLNNTANPNYIHPDASDYKEVLDIVDQKKQGISKELVALRKELLEHMEKKGKVLSAGLNQTSLFDLNNLAPSEKTELSDALKKDGITVSHLKAYEDDTSIQGTSEQGTREQGGGGIAGEAGAVSEVVRQSGYEPGRGAEQNQGGAGATSPLKDVASTTKALEEVAARTPDVVAKMNNYLGYVSYEDAVKIIPQADFTNLPEGKDEASREARSQLMRDQEKKPPQFTSYPIGTRAVDRFGEVYELKELPFTEIITKNEGTQREATVHKYADWIKEGHQMPPLRGVENFAVEGGKVSITDGAHRVLAAKEAGLDKVPVWVALTDKENTARPVYLTKAISETYHQAKKDGRNPNLVRAVEDIVGKPTEVTQTGVAATTPLTNIEQQKADIERRRKAALEKDGLTSLQPLNKEDVFKGYYREHEDETWLKAMDILKSILPERVGNYVFRQAAFEQDEWAITYAIESGAPYTTLTGRKIRNTVDVRVVVSVDELLHQSEEALKQLIQQRVENDLYTGLGLEGKGLDTEDADAVRANNIRANEINAAYDAELELLQKQDQPLAKRVDEEKAALRSVETTTRALVGTYNPGYFTPKLYLPKNERSFIDKANRGEDLGSVAQIEEYGDGERLRSALKENGYKEVDFEDKRDYEISDILQKETDRGYKPILFHKKDQKLYNERTWYTRLKNSAPYSVLLRPVNVKEKSVYQSVSEAYHQAISDSSNPPLVRAVKDFLHTFIEPKHQAQSIVGQDVDLRGDTKGAAYLFERDEFLKRIEREIKENHYYVVGYTNKDTLGRYAVRLGRSGTNQVLSNAWVIPESKDAVYDEKEIVARGLPLITEKMHKDSVVSALEPSKEHQLSLFDIAIAQGRMTAQDAKTIVESAGLKVPEQIERLVAEEQKGVFVLPSPSPLKDVASTTEALEEVTKRTSDAIEKALLSQMTTSKVADENHHPIIVYRGTNKEGEVSGTTTAWHGAGIYFSDKEGEASLYGKAKKAIINIVRPFDLTQVKDTSVQGSGLVGLFADTKGLAYKKLGDYTFKELHQIIQELEKSVDESKIGMYDGSKDFFKNLSIDYNGKEYTVRNRTQTEYEDLDYIKSLFISQILEQEYHVDRLPIRISEAIDPAEFSNILKKNGYDGVIAENSTLPTGNEYVVFDKSQVQELTPNSISEAYHKAKANGTRPELVKAVEDLLRKPAEATSPTRSLLGSDVDLKGNKKVSPYFFERNEFLERIKRALDEKKYHIDVKTKKDYKGGYTVQLRREGDQASFGKIWVIPESKDDTYDRNEIIERGLPLVAEKIHRDSVALGIEPGEKNQPSHFDKALSEGRMTAQDAKTIIESAGLEVPEQIKRMAAEKEEDVSALPSALRDVTVTTNALEDVAKRNPDLFKKLFLQNVAITSDNFMDYVDYLKEGGQLAPRDLIVLGRVASKHLKEERDELYKRVSRGEITFEETDPSKGALGKELSQRQRDINSLISSQPNAYGLEGDINLPETYHFTTSENVLQILEDDQISGEGETPGVSTTTNKAFDHPELTQVQWYGEGNKPTTFADQGVRIDLDLKKLKEDGIRLKTGDEDIGTFVGEEEIRIGRHEGIEHASNYIKRIQVDPEVVTEEELEEIRSKAEELGIPVVIKEDYEKPVNQIVFFARQISEAYYKAKKDGSNPALVKAVEDLFSKPAEAVQPGDSLSLSPLKDVASTTRALEGVSARTPDVVTGIASQFLPKKEADYARWKRKNVRYIDKKDVGKMQNGTFGRGLYTIFPSQEARPKGDGERFFVVNARPENPKVFDDIHEWEQWLNSTVTMYGQIFKKKNYGIKNFLRDTTIADVLLNYEYDGVEIKGKEMVHFVPPKDVRYFKTEGELKNYFEQLSHEDVHDAVSEAYHKAKKEGNDSELVKAVEGLFSKPAEAVQPAGFLSLSLSPLKDVASTTRALEGVSARTPDVVTGIAAQFLPKKETDYATWKRKRVVYRGVKEVGKENERSGMLGKGLYTTPSSNKSMTKEYGDRFFVLNARPQHPKVFNSLNDWEIWFQNNLVFPYSKKLGKSMPETRDFDKHTTIEAELQKLGFDGIEIKGREMVHFKPQDVKYFKTEGELKDYFERLQHQNIDEEVSEAYHKAKTDGSNPQLVQAVKDLLVPSRSIETTPKEKLFEDKGEKLEVGDGYANYILDEIDKRHREVHPNEDIRTPLAKQWEETKKDRGVDRANSNLEETLMNYIPLSVRSEAYQTLRRNYEKQSVSPRQPIGSILNSRVDLKGNEKEEAMEPLVYPERSSFNVHDEVYVKSDTGLNQYKKRNRYSVRGKENGKYVLLGKDNGANLFVLKEEIERKTTDKREPISGRLDAIDYALGNHLYQAWIAEGRMSAKDAQTIIASAGLRVPEDIERIASEEVEAQPAGSSAPASLTDVVSSKEALPVAAWKEKVGASNLKVIEGYHTEGPNGERPTGAKLLRTGFMLGSLEKEIEDAAWSGSVSFDKFKDDIAHQLQEYWFGESGLLERTMNKLVDMGIVQRVRKEDDMWYRRLLIPYQLEVGFKGPEGHQHYYRDVLMNLQQGELPHNIAQVMVNDFLNTLSLNQILRGDEAKLGHTDKMAYAKGASISGMSIYSDLEAPYLGIHHPGRTSHVVHIQEPLYVRSDTGTVGDKGKGQLFLTTKGLRYALFGIGKLTPTQAGLLDKIEQGESVAARNVLQKGDLLTYDGRLHTISLSYFDGQHSMDTSGFVLTKEYTSYKDPNKGWQPLPQRAELHYLREKLEQYELAHDTITMAVTGSTEEGQKINVAADVDSIADGNFQELDNHFWFTKPDTPSDVLEILDPSKARELILDEQDDARKVRFTWNKEGLKSDTELTVGELKQLYLHYSAERLNNNYEGAKNELFDFQETLNELQASINLGKVTPRLAALYKDAMSRMESTGVDTQTLGFFALDKTSGEPAFNLNSPLTVKQFTKAVFDYFSKGVLQEKVPGYEANVLGNVGLVLREVFALDDAYQPKVSRVITTGEYKKNPELYQNILAWEPDPALKDADERMKKANAQMNRKYYSLKDRFANRRRGERIFVLDDLRSNVPEYAFDEKTQTIQKDEHGNDIILDHYTEFMASPQSLEVMKMAPHLDEIPDALSRAYGSRRIGQQGASSVSLRLVDFLPIFYGSSVVTAPELSAEGNGFAHNQLSVATTDMYVKEQSGERFSFHAYGEATTPEDAFEEFVIWQGLNNKKVQEEAIKARHNFRVTIGTEFAAATATDQKVDVFEDRQWVLTALKKLGLPYTVAAYRDAQQQGRELNGGRLNNALLDAKSKLAGFEKEALKAEGSKSLKEIAQHFLETFPALKEQLEDVQEDVDTINGKAALFPQLKKGARSAKTAMEAQLALQFLNRYGIDLRTKNSDGNALWHFRMDGVDFTTYHRSRAYNPATKAFDGERIAASMEGVMAAVRDRTGLLAGKLRLHPDAIEVLSHMAGMGVPLEWGLKLLMQPAVRTYFEGLENSRSPVQAPLSTMKGRHKRGEEMLLGFKDRGGKGDLELTDKLLNDNILTNGINPRYQYNVLDTFLKLKDQAEYFTTLGELLSNRKGFSNDDFDSFDLYMKKLQLDLDDAAFERSSIPIDVRQALLGVDRTKPYHEVMATHIAIYKQLQQLLKTILLARTDLFADMKEGVLANLDVKDVDRKAFEQQLDNDLISWLGIEAYKKMLEDNNDKVRLLSLTNGMIYDDVAEQKPAGFLNAVETLLAIKEKLPDNTFVKSFLHALPVRVVTEDGELIRNPHAYGGINKVEINTWARLNRFRVEELQKSFLEILDHPETSHLAWALFHYLLVKDGLQWRSGSFMKFIPNAMFKELLDGIGKANELFARNASDAEFIQLLGATPDQLLNKFATNYMLHAANKEYIPKRKLKEATRMVSYSKGLKTEADIRKYEPQTHQLEEGMFTLDLWGGLEGLKGSKEKLPGSQFPVASSQLPVGGQELEVEEVDAEDVEGAKKKETKEERLERLKFEKNLASIKGRGFDVRGFEGNREGAIEFPFVIHDFAEVTKTGDLVQSVYRLETVDGKKVSDADSFHFMNRKEKIALGTKATYVYVRSEGSSEQWAGGGGIDPLPTESKAIRAPIPISQHVGFSIDGYRESVKKDLDEAVYGEAGEKWLAEHSSKVLDFEEKENVRIQIVDGDVANIRFLRNNVLASDQKELKQKFFSTAEQQAVVRKMSTIEWKQAFEDWERTNAKKIQAFGNRKRLDIRINYEGAEAVIEFYNRSNQQLAINQNRLRIDLLKAVGYEPAVVKDAQVALTKEGHLLEQGVAVPPLSASAEFYLNAKFPEEDLLVHRGDVPFNSIATRMAPVVDLIEGHPYYEDMAAMVKKTMEKLKCG